MSRNKARRFEEKPRRERRTERIESERRPERIEGERIPEKIERERRPKKKKSFLKKVFIILIPVVIIALIMILILGIFVGGKFSKLNFININKDEIGISEAAKVDLSNYRNIALLGVDEQDEYDNGNRSDCIIIASINKKTNEVNLISVYRDTYVEVDENGKTVLDKINHAYAYGGAQNLLLSLNKALDLNISEYVAADFYAVAEVVDSLGGIELDITKDELEYINGYAKDVARVTKRSYTPISYTGRQTVNGVQAVAYCRIRYTAGMDYKRTERMRTVISTIFAKAKTKGIGELNSLLDKVLPMISTNISGTEILGMIPQAMRYNVKENYGWPYKTKGYKVSIYYGVPCTLETNVVRLHKELFGQENYQVSDTVKKMSEKIIEETGYTADVKDADEYEKWNI